MRTAVALLASLFVLCGDTFAADAPSRTADQPKAKAAPKDVPTHADVSYGPHPHQLMDIYLPKGKGPFPVLVWYGAIWVPKKGPANLGMFLSHQCAEIAVQTRSMTDAQKDHVNPPISYVLSDARRAVKYVHLHAKDWNLDPDRIATGGSSQAAVPALFAACTAATADAQSADPVDREIVHPVAVALHRGPGSIDPKRLQEWNPGVEWGAPAWGCSVPESIRRYHELYPVISKWSPEYFVGKNTPPIFIENEWGLTRPENIAEANYRTHSPLWGIGLKKYVEARGVTCYQKYPGLKPEKYKDIWDFLVRRLQPTAKQ
jgi:acetyl esterase/lipase